MKCPTFNEGDLKHALVNDRVKGDGDVETSVGVFILNYPRVPIPEKEHVPCDSEITWFAPDNENITYSGKGNPGGESTTLSLKKSPAWGMSHNITVNVEWNTSWMDEFLPEEEENEGEHQHDPYCSEDSSIVVVAPKIELKEIHFNNNRGDCTADGFNIWEAYNKNKIIAPEWKKDESVQKPVAYISGISSELKYVFYVQRTLLKTAKLDMFPGHHPSRRLLMKEKSVGTGLPVTGWNYFQETQNLAYITLKNSQYSVKTR